MARWLSSLLILGVGVAGGYLIGHRVGTQTIFQSVPVGFNLVDSSQVTNPSGMSWPCTNAASGGCAQTVSIRVSFSTVPTLTAPGCPEPACIQFSGTAATKDVAATISDYGVPGSCWDPTPVYVAGTVAFKGLRRPGGAGNTH
jgi:hypothetical protein